jgi:hypothetical protein
MIDIEDEKQSYLYYSRLSDWQMFVDINVE